MVDGTTLLKSLDKTGAPEHILVAVSGSPSSNGLVLTAARLASHLSASWEVIYIETPETSHDIEDFAIAETLSLASSLGATIAKIPAATVLDGITSHLDQTPAEHLVLGTGKERAWCARYKRTLLDALTARQTGLILHLIPCQLDPRADHGKVSGPPTALFRDFAFSALSVAVTLFTAELLHLIISARSLDLLFLCPVIVTSARAGLRPAFLAVALSVVCYNYFLLSPALSFDATAPQNLVMTGVLVSVAVYISSVTTEMRGRLVLSDRSARENASLATLAQKLTRDADWETTAHTICEHVNALLKVRAAVYREVDGKLVLTGAVPSDVQLGPVDQAALESAWSNGGQAGAGTITIAASNWQFQPLATSLGILAVLAIARDDGRDPVRADQRILLQTLVAQAALAHERLRLESHNLI